MAYWACDYLSMLGLKLNHVSKAVIWFQLEIRCQKDDISEGCMQEPFLNILSFYLEIKKRKATKHSIVIWYPQIKSIWSADNIWQCYAKRTGDTAVLH